MNNYNFEKYIYKKENNYYLELNLPNNFSSFIYKIYGNEGYYNFGKFKYYKNSGNNVFIININNPQTIFITFTLENEQKEYFDFINMIDEIENNPIEIKRNIRVSVIRKEKIDINEFEINKNETDSDSSDSDSDSSDSDSDLDHDDEVKDDNNE
jgi:hypothetical protein